MKQINSYRIGNSYTTTLRKSPIDNNTPTKIILTNLNFACISILFSFNIFSMWILEDYINKYRCWKPHI